MNPKPNHDEHKAVPEQHAADEAASYVIATENGIRLEHPDERRRHRVDDTQHRMSQTALGLALAVRAAVSGAYPRDGVCLPAVTPAEAAAHLDRIAAGILLVPKSERWREAVSTALVGPWCDPLWKTGQLPATALGALKAEACTLHVQLVPVWRRGNRHGRVLSLDADLGGLSLYDLVAADVDLLTHAAGGVFEDERLNAVLRSLTPEERAVVFAYAEGEGTTWTEAAAYAGAANPNAFAERVRRKAKRLAAEQHRRATQRYPGPPVA